MTIAFYKCHTKSMTKGFTLIELLVTIAVMAVLAIGGFMALDPMDKIKTANDSKVQTDISQLAAAVGAYGVTHAGFYPIDFPTLLTSGEIKALPTAPNNYAAYSLGQTSGSPTFQSVCGELKAKKYSGTLFWVWCSSTGKIGPVSSCGSCP